VPVSFVGFGFLERSINQNQKLIFSCCFSAVSTLLNLLMCFFYSPFFFVFILGSLQQKSLSVDPKSNSSFHQLISPAHTDRSGIVELLQGN